MYNNEITFHVGQNYKVNHTRKGKFNITLTSEDEVWISGKIIEGYADAIHDNNIRIEGDTITFRKSLCEITPL